MPRVFLISDNHFGAWEFVKNVFPPRKKFKNGNEMDDFMIKKWNKTVKQDDMIFSMGDFTYESMEDFE